MPKYSSGHELYKKLIKAGKASVERYEGKEDNYKLKDNFSDDKQIPLGTNFDGGEFRRARPNELIK